MLDEEDPVGRRRRQAELQPDPVEKRLSEPSMQSESEYPAFRILHRFLIMDVVPLKEEESENR